MCLCVCRLRLRLCRRRPLTECDVSRRRKSQMPDDDIFKTAPHTPAHLFRADAIHMITGAIYQKLDLIHTAPRKAKWRDSFVKASEIYDWNIIAWVVLNNHYHALVKSPKGNATTLPKYISSFHKFTSRLWNSEDETRGRRVWWNYWDACIRNERDFLTRLKHIFWNPVKHGLVERPEDYPFSNYKEYLRSWKTGFEFSDVNEASDVQEF